MQPNNQQLPPVHDPSYLDTIAVKPHAKTMNPFILWGLIGGGLLLAVLAILAIASAGGPSNKEKLTTFAARMSSLQAISEDVQEDIQSSELRTLNSNLTLVLANANRDLAPLLSDQKISLKEKKNEQVKAVAADTTELTDRLEDARLNAVFDRTYAREIKYYLTSLRSEMRELYGASKSTSLKEVLASTDKNIKPLRGDFSSFNAG